MKLQLLAIVVFIFCPAIGESSQRLRRTLSAITKKPASPGWLSLPHTPHLSPHISFSPPAPLSRQSLTPFSLLFKLQVASFPA
jgi:hypothetical protein